MKRRNFLRTIAPAVVLPSIINGFSMKAFAEMPLFRGMEALQTETDKVLVLIQLNGGNDGINTVIPLDQYANLSVARGNILINSSAVLPLTGTTVTGLHPAMTGMRDLYDGGKVKIVQGVSYPNPNFSHFAATDIWATASDSDQSLNTGWLGRYIDHEFPGFPAGYPNASSPDPIAVQIGVGLPLMFQAPGGLAAISVSGTSIFNGWTIDGANPAPGTYAGQELAFARSIAQQTQSYAARLTLAASNVTTQSPSYPTAGTNTLADQLKVVAQLIAGGLQSRVYLVSLGGFDTHSGQVDTTDTSIGTHADLLGKLSAAVKAFMDDLTFLNIANRVTGMTFSEFGRRIISNASGGCDHGVAAPLFVFGHQVQGGILGNNPTIPAVVTSNDNVPMQYDFRSIYATMLKDWFCLDQTAIDDIMLQPFSTLPVVNSACCVPPTPVITGSSAVCIGTQNYSVPATAGHTYVWDVVGGTILSGQGTNQIQVQWSSGTVGTVSVTESTP
ncbi:MAG: DUF1501 domain-containing protein [Sphingobacteriales bacterium]|nr:DUF1501 domain-containing protein [Sphingobacteriales bacterium]